MLVPEYFVALRDREKDSLAQLASHLQQMPKKPVGEVTVSELCSIAEYPNGLYLLFDVEDDLWYVGKATSRSFIGRIPSHFDQREDAWFNTVPKKIMTFAKMNVYSDAHVLGLSLRLVLVGIQEKSVTVQLEDMLRAYMKPRLNTKHGATLSGDEPLPWVDA